MEMPAFDQIILLHMILLLPDIISATAIVKAAVIIKVVVAVIVVHAIPREVVLMTDATEATPGGDPIHMTHHNLSHLNNTTTGHDLTEDIDLTPTAGADLDHQKEGTDVIPVLQIANISGMPQSLPGRNNTELIKAVKCSHRLSKPSHKASYRSSCQNC